MEVIHKEIKFNPLDLCLSKSRQIMSYVKYEFDKIKEEIENDFIIHKYDIFEKNIPYYIHCYVTFHVTAKTEDEKYIDKLEYFLNL